jgi:hypothetical protein
MTVDKIFLDEMMGCPLPSKFIVLNLLQLIIFNLKVDRGPEVSCPG